MNKQVEFKFNNDAKSLPNISRGDYTWYEWTIYMDEDDTKLDSVDKVEYHLHPSFPDPIQVVTNRDTKFAFSARGWGTFRIDIVIYLKDGSEAHAHHSLKF